MSSLRDRRRGKRASLDEQIAQLAGVRPILTVSLARNQAWLRGRAMPASSLPGRSHTRASSANGQTLDGVWSVFGSGVARDVPGRGQLDEVSRANKCTNYNAAPNGSLTGLTKFGDAAATLTEVDDSAALAAAGLQNLCPSGKVFKLDNSAGVADAVAWCAGTTANTNTHTASAYVRGGTGSFAQYSAGGTPFGAWTASSSYVRRVGTFTPVDTSRVCAIVANAGQVVYFILNQLEEGSFVTSPIVVAGASATRAADVATIDLLNPGLYDVSGQPELKSGGTISTIGTATPATYDTGTGAGVINRTDGSNNSGVLIPATSGKLFVIDIEKTGGVGSVQVRQDSVGGAILATITTRTTLVLRLPSGSGIYISNGANGTSANFTLHSLKEIPAEQVIDYPCTIWVEFERVVDTGNTTEMLLIIDDNTASNRLYCAVNVSDQFRYLSSSGGTTDGDANVSTPTVPLGASRRGAVAFAANNMRGAFAGALGGLDGACTAPAAPPNKIRFGSNITDGNECCGYIRAISIVPGRRPDANLERLAA